MEALSSALEPAAGVGGLLGLTDVVLFLADLTSS